jgi:hypothetical protein
MDEELFYGLDDDEIENINHTQRVNINAKGSKNDSELFGLRRNSKDDSNLNMKSIALLNQANDNIYSEEIKEIEELSNRKSQIKIQSLTINLSDNIKNNYRGKFYDEAYENIERKALPAVRKKINLNVWGILKEAVTKDLSKFCVPGM